MIHQLRALAARLRGLFGDRIADQELDDEIETHSRLLTERYVRQGMTEAEAAWAARRQFGNVTLLKEANREMRGIRLIDTLFQDLRYASRMLRKNPGGAFVAVLTLALGIGANTAIFSFLEGIILRPLPYRQPEQIVILRQQLTRAGIEQMDFSVSEINDYRQQNSALSAVVEYHTDQFVLQNHATAERVQTGVVSADFFYRDGHFCQLIKRGRLRWSSSTKHLRGAAWLERSRLASGFPATEARPGSPSLASWEILRRSVSTRISPTKSTIRWTSFLALQVANG